MAENVVKVSIVIDEEQLQASIERVRARLAELDGPAGGITLTAEEAQLALGAIEDQIAGIYHRPTLRALGALAHRLDPDFPAPEDDEDDEDAS